MKNLLAYKNNHYLFTNGEYFWFTTDYTGKRWNVNQFGTKQEVLDELNRWKIEVDQNNPYMLEVENNFINVLESL